MKRWQIYEVNCQVFNTIAHPATISKQYHFKCITNINYIISISIRLKQKYKKSFYNEYADSLKN